MQDEVDLAGGDLGGGRRGRHQHRGLDDAVAALVEVDDALDLPAPGRDLLEITGMRVDSAERVTDGNSVSRPSRSAGAPCPSAAGSPSGGCPAIGRWYGKTVL
jgi:hypothetical protein